MTKPAQIAGTMIPCLGYHDARAAIDWLGRAFGFKPHAVYDGPNSTVAHAELTLGSGMIMMGSMATEGPFAKLLVHPDQIDGKQTQAPYIVVDDADAIYATAKAAGIGRSGIKSYQRLMVRPEGRDEVGHFLTGSILVRGQLGKGGCMDKAGAGQRDLQRHPASERRQRLGCGTGADAWEDHPHRSEDVRG